MRHRRYLVLLCILAVTAVINVAAWESAAFCDFYVRNIYPLWINTYGRITGLFSFSVGEMMIVSGLALAAAAVLLGTGCVISILFMKKNAILVKLRGFTKRFYAGLSWILTGIFVLLTLNCFIPYHSSTLEEKYDLLNRQTENTAEYSLENLAGELLAKEYTIEELSVLRDYVVIKTNDLAERVERDENGAIIFPENIEEIAAGCMNSLSEKCEQLKGYYPAPKKIKFSGFLSQQHMKGYFFPFSMEANYNGMMHPINIPATVCHEYAHLKGFMYEDEANMIGFLACINSTDLTFQYSGYLSILNYVNNEFYNAIGKNNEVYASHVKISPKVKAENVFLAEAAWEKVEENAVIKTELVDKISDKLSETSMVLNGVEDGILSYTRVVGLLLNYYDGSQEIQQTLASSAYYVKEE